MRAPVMLLLAAFLVPVHAAESGRAESLFAALAPAVVQVRVIDEASGDRVAIGSGFQVDAGGLIATNFHVVAEEAGQPSRHRLEYIDAGGAPVGLELLDVDVVNDLALLRAQRPLPGVAMLADEAPAQGQRLWSIGNPLDLAMTIIEGTYNGFVQGARHRKILFSGSLNPGMSGGPALDAEGRVVGVNVAHGGEQISFLVPVENLAALMRRASAPGRLQQDIETRVGEALRQDQDAWIGELLASPWSTQSLGGFRVPGRIGAATRCWGGSGNEPDQLYEHLQQQCSSEDTIFIEPALETGGLRYAFDVFSSHQLGMLRFYGLLRSQFAHDTAENGGDGRQRGNFRCREDFVRGRGTDWRVSFCARPYRRFPGLYDVSVALASTDPAQHGLVAQLGIDGISEDRARVFTRRFLEGIEWQP